jgi:predicted PurR-regulated permease PerM
VTQSDASPRHRRPMALPPMSHYAKATATILCVIGFALVLLQTRSVAASVFLGFFFAAGLEPFVKRLERRGLRRGHAVLLLVLGALAVFAAICWLMIAPAVRQAGDLVAAIPQLLTELSQRGSIFGVRLDDPQVQQKLQQSLDKIPALLTASLGTVYGIVGGVATAAFGLFTVFALTIYFMLAMPRLRSFAARALGDPERVLVMEQALDRIGGYVTGQLIVSLSAGVFAGIVLTILGVPYAAILGLAVAFLDAIPQVGATIGAVLCTLVALTENVGLAVTTFLVMLAYQQFENFVLGPRVFSRAVDLSPIAVFIAVLVGAGVGGAIGALTALPVTASLKVIFRYLFRDRLGQIETAPVPGATLGAAPHGGRILPGDGADDPP